MRGQWRWGHIRGFPGPLGFHQALHRLGGPYAAEGGAVVSTAGRDAGPGAVHLRRPVRRAGAGSLAVIDHSIGGSLRTTRRPLSCSAVKGRWHQGHLGCVWAVPGRGGAPAPAYEAVGSLGPGLLSASGSPPRAPVGGGWHGPPHHPVPSGPRRQPSWGEASPGPGVREAFPVAGGALHRVRRGPGLGPEASAATPGGGGARESCRGGAAWRVGSHRSDPIHHGPVPDYHPLPASVSPVAWSASLRRGVCYPPVAWLSGGNAPVPCRPRSVRMAIGPLHDGLRPITSLQGFESQAKM